MTTRDEKKLDVMNRAEYDENQRIVHATGPDKHGSVYVYMKCNQTVATVRALDDADVICDYNAQGELIGIEVLGVPAKINT